jgi:hypothetical protein
MNGVTYLCILAGGWEDTPSRRGWLFDMSVMGIGCRLYPSYANLPKFGKRVLWMMVTTRAVGRNRLRFPTKEIDDGRNVGGFFEPDKAQLIDTVSLVNPISLKST